MSLRIQRNIGRASCGRSKLCHFFDGLVAPAASPNSSREIAPDSSASNFLKTCWETTGTHLENRILKGNAEMLVFAKHVGAKYRRFMCYLSCFFAIFAIHCVSNENDLDSTTAVGSKTKSATIGWAMFAMLRSRHSSQVVTLADWC